MIREADPMSSPAEIVRPLPAASMVVIDDRPELHVLIGKRRPGAFVAAGGDAPDTSCAAEPVPVNWFNLG